MGKSHGSDNIWFLMHSLLGTQEMEEVSKFAHTAVAYESQYRGDSPKR